MTERTVRHLLLVDLTTLFAMRCNANYQQWKADRASDFHPHEQDDALSRQWLRDHSDQFVRIGATVQVFA